MNPSFDPTSQTLLHYEGEMSADRTEELLVEARQLADKGDITRSAFRIFIELVQNIRIHGGAKGAVTMEHVGRFMIVSSRNHATKENAGRVQETIMKANRHAKDIAAIISEIRKSPLANGANGAGLGLYEIRRLASRDVETSATPTPDGNSELVIRAAVQHNFTP